jgi:hypothetical protein
MLKALRRCPRKCRGGKEGGKAGGESKLQQNYGHLAFGLQGSAKKIEIMYKLSHIHYRFQDCHYRF